MTAKGHFWQAQARAASTVAPTQYSLWITSNTVEILDTPTTPPTSVQISPDPASKTNPQLQAVAAGHSDIDVGDTPTIQYEWQVTPNAGAGAPSGWVYTGNTLSNTLWNRGDLVEARASIDGVTWCPPDALVISDALPSQPATVVINAVDLYTDSDLVAVAAGATDLDAPPDTVDGYQYQWATSVDNVTYSAFATRPVTPDTYPAANTTRGIYYKARARAISSVPATFGAWRESAPVRILDSDPTEPLSVDIKPDTPTSDEELTVTANGSIDADDDLITYEFQWVRVRGGVLSIWGFRVGPTVSASETERGDHWIARAYAVANGRPSPTSSFTDDVEIGDSRPTPPDSVTVTANPDPAVKGSILTASATGGGDSDGDAVTLNYEWRWRANSGAAWSAYGAFTGPKILGTETHRFEEWQAQAWYTQDVFTGVKIESNPITIGDTKPTPPTMVTITANPAPARTNSTLTALALGGGDVDGETVSPTYEWRVYSAGAWTAYGYVAGDTVTADKIVKGQRWQVRARAEAGGDHSDWVECDVDDIVDIVDSPPTAPTVFALAADPDPATTDSTLRATASGAQDADGETVNYRYQWSYKPKPTADWSEWTTGTANLNPSNTRKNETWRFQVSAGSGTIWSDWQISNEIVIGDTPPVSPDSSGVTYSPANPKTTDAVTATLSGVTDRDLAPNNGPDGLGYIYQWHKVAGTGSFTDPGNATIDPQNTTKGDIFYCTITPYTDDNVHPRVSGTPVDGPTITIQNSAPDLPAAPPTIGTAPYAAKTSLTASVANPPEDPDSDPVTLSYKWYRSLNQGGTWGPPQAGTGANGATLPVDTTIKGECWKVKLTITDNDSTPLETTIESAFVTITDNAPVGANVPVTVTISPENARTSDPLTAVPTGGEDPDGDAITYKVLWASSDDGSTWSAWGNEGETLPASQTTKRQQWKARAWAVSGFPPLEGVFGDSNIITIANTLPPAPASVTITPAEPTGNTQLVASAFFVNDSNPTKDADDEVVSPVYQWSKSTDNGVNWSAWEDGAGNALHGGTTLAAVLVLTGDRWRCRAAYTDDDSLGPWRTSPSVSIINSVPTPPTVLTITADPKPATTLSILTAAATGGSDGDGPAPTYHYEWCFSTDGATWSAWAYPSASLPTSATTKGQQWKARAYSFDGTAMSATAFEGPPVTIRDARPTPPTNVSLTPSSPVAGNNLTAQASGATDPDGDTGITYLYYWSHRTPTNSTWTPWEQVTEIPGAEVVRGDQWRYTAEAMSDGLRSAMAPAKWITIGNTPPTAPDAFEITPGSPLTTDDLTASVSGSTDVDEGDDDLLTYQLQWSKSTDNGATWTPWGYTGDVLDDARTARGQLWKARARAFDRRNYGPFTVSNTVEIINSTPTAPTEVALGPGDGNFSDSLVASALGSTDADGDSLSYTFQWSRSSSGGSTWSAWGWSGDTLPSELVATADMWRVRARATDSVTSSGWLTSAPLQLQVLVRTTKPLHGATNVMRAAPVNIWFYRAVDQASAQAHFTLKTTAGARVTGTFKWNDAGNRFMAFTPARALAANTLYRASFSPGVEYVGGGATTWTQAFSFTTGDEPAVISATPIGNAVAVNSKVTVKFDQDMSQSSVNANFRLKNPDGSAVAGKRVWFDKRQVTFEPTYALDPSTTYAVYVGMGCRTADGAHTLRVSYTWSFTTGSNAAPLALASATAQSTAAGAQITVNLTAAADVRIAICNIAGRVVAVLPSATLPSGTTTLLWDGRSTTGTRVPAGQYLVKVEANSAGGGSAHAVTSLRR